MVSLIIFSFVALRETAQTIVDVFFRNPTFKKSFSIFNHWWQLFVILFALVMYLIWINVFIFIRSKNIKMHFSNIGKEPFSSFFTYIFIQAKFFLEQIYDWKLAKRTETDVWATC